jgi:hypothetical protein
VAKGPRRLTPEKSPSRVYHQVWRLVDGAVRQAFRDHPEYLADGKRERTVRNSINKRVVGALIGFVGTAARRGVDPVE